MGDLAIFAAEAAHESTIFSLVPLSDAAISVLSHPHNRSLVSALSLPRGRSFGLNIGPHIPSKPNTTLAVLGRVADIRVDDPSVSRTQCSFEVNETNGEIFLRDLSSSGTTQTTGDTSIPFSIFHKPRRVLITPAVNLEFEFGKYHFEIFWHEKGANLASIIHQKGINLPCDAPTVYETPAARGSQRATRLHAARSPDKMLRWVPTRFLGRGTFGAVHSAIDVDTGDIFAVKTIKLEGSEDEVAERRALVKQEVDILQRVNHANIVEYIAFQEQKDNLFEIMTGLKDGNVDDLAIRTNRFADYDQLQRFSESILEALAFLHKQNIIHRDVKPQNILFTQSKGCDSRYLTYQLADFGSACFLGQTGAYARTLGFVAPEVIELASAQSSKMDIWSLLVTMMHVSNHGDIRAAHLPIEGREREYAVQIGEAAQHAPFHEFLMMAEFNPQKRASAEDMLWEIQRKKQDSSRMSYVMNTDVVAAEDQSRRQAPQEAKGNTIVRRIMPDRKAKSKGPF